MLTTDTQIEPAWIPPIIKRADNLARQARAAAAAGDHQRAADLRAEYDRVWSQLEAALNNPEITGPNSHLHR